LYGCACSWRTALLGVHSTEGCGRSSALAYSTMRPGTNGDDQSLGSSGNVVSKQLMELARLHGPRTDDLPPAVDRVRHMSPGRS
jgi:hypothetical protein